MAPKKTGYRCRLVLPDEITETLTHFRDTNPRRMNAYVWLLIEAGWTQTSLARALDVSFQAIQSRLREPRDFTDLPAVPAPPKPEPPAAIRKKKLHLPPTVIEELRKQHAVARTVNGGTAEDDPRRQVSIDFTARLAKLVEQGVTVYEIAKALGVNHAAVYSRLARHGYRAPCPSQEGTVYTGRKIGSR